jgi:hypothetical protein
MTRSAHLGLLGGLALLLALVANPAAATCPYSGNTAGTDSAAQLSALNDLCAASAAAIPAGENHLGEIGGNTFPVTVAQTVTASAAYSANNAVGGLITIAGAKRASAAPGAHLQSVIIDMKSAQTTAIDVVIFNANPTGSTCTDKTAFSVAAADFNKVVGVAHVTDWTSLGTPSVGQSQNLALPFDLSGATTAYACVVTRGTPTFAATTDASVTFLFERN